MRVVVGFERFEISTEGRVAPVKPELAAIRDQDALVEGLWLLPCFGCAFFFTSMPTMAA